MLTSGTISSVSDTGSAVDVNGNVLINTIASMQTAVQAHWLGQRSIVTDAVSCVFMQPVVGGGTLFCPVIWDGKQWVAG